MATRKKVDRGAHSPPEPMAETPRVKVGDVVMYSHRRFSADAFMTAPHLVPMIVTTVFDSGRINGVAFSDSEDAAGFVGSKVVFEVEEGKEEGTWQHRA